MGVRLFQIFFCSTVEEKKLAFAHLSNECLLVCCLSFESRFTLIIIRVYVGNIVRNFWKYLPWGNCHLRLKKNDFESFLMKTEQKMFLFFIIIQFLITINNFSIIGIIKTIVPKIFLQRIKNNLKRNENYLFFYFFIFSNVHSTTSRPNSHPKF